MTYTALPFTSEWDKFIKMIRERQLKSKKYMLLIKIFLIKSDSLTSSRIYHFMLNTSLHSQHHRIMNKYKLDEASEKYKNSF